MSARGKFITLEGGEGVGKSTQAKALAEALKQIGIDCVITREPGGSPGAEAIRELILTGDKDRWTPEAEALLFAAARADHVARTIEPALAAGRWVISDRYFDSSVAYQGFAGGLGYEEIYQLSEFAGRGLFPDRTLVLVTPDGDRRAAARDQGGSDRIGGRGAEYHLAAMEGFETLAYSEPDRVRLVDASGSPEDVTARLLAEIADLLP